MLSEPHGAVQRQNVGCFPREEGRQHDVMIKRLCLLKADEDESELLLQLHMIYLYQHVRTSYYMFPLLN